MAGQFALLLALGGLLLFLLFGVLLGVFAEH
jgi:hypothetical protein